MFLQQSFNESAHFGTGRLFALPVNRFILTKCICQLFCNCNQFFIFVKILDCLRFRECIVECQFISCKTELFALFVGFCQLFCEFQHFCNDFFIGEHTIQICVNSSLHDLAELFGLHHIRSTINRYLFCYQFFQQLDCQVLLFHSADFFKEFRIKQREFLLHIREQVNDTLALDTLLQKLIDTSVHFRQRDFFAGSSIGQSQHQDTHRFKERSFKAISFTHQGRTKRKSLMKHEGFLYKSVLFFFFFTGDDIVYRTTDGLCSFQIGSGSELGVIKSMEHITADTQLFDKLRISDFGNIRITIVFLITGGVVIHCLF